MYPYLYAIANRRRFARTGHLPYWNFTCTVRAVISMGRRNTKL